MAIQPMRLCWLFLKLMQQTQVLSTAVDGSLTFQIITSNGLPQQDGWQQSVQAVIVITQV